MRSRSPLYCTMSHLESSTLSWCLLFVDSYDEVESIFASEGSRIFDYCLMSSYSPLSIQDAWPKSVDAPLMLIFRIELRCCWNHCWREIRRIVQSWIDVVIHPLDYPGWKDWNRWCPIDAHILSIASMVSKPLLHQKEANSTIIGYDHHTTLGFSKMDCYKLLRLHWPAILRYSSIDIAASFARKGGW